MMDELWREEEKKTLESIAKLAYPVPVSRYRFHPATCG